MVIFRSGNLYSLCSPGNQNYPKIIYFFFIKKVEIDNAKVVFLLELAYIFFDYRTIIADFDLFEKIKKVNIRFVTGKLSCSQIQQKRYVL